MKNIVIDIVMFSVFAMPSQAQPDLTLTKLAFISGVPVSSPVIVGEDSIYGFEVRNIGSAVASGVVITDTLPGTLTFSALGPDCTESAGIVTCDVSGLLQPGATAGAVFLVTPTVTGNITNSAFVTAIGAGYQS